MYEFSAGHSDFALETAQDLEWTPTRRIFDKTITLSLADYPTNEEARLRMEAIASELGLVLKGNTRVITGRWVQEVADG